MAPVDLSDAFLTNAEARYLDAARKHSEWLDPIRTIKLAQSVIAGLTEVKLGDTWFTIRYVGPKVYVRPRKGFAPCGWFEIERLRTYLDIIQVKGE